MPLLPCLSRFFHIFARVRTRLHGEPARHPRQFALRAAGDVVVGDGIADGVVFTRGGGADEPFGDGDVEFFQRDALTVLPLLFEVLGQLRESFVRLMLHDQWQGFAEAA